MRVPTNKSKGPNSAGNIILQFSRVCPSIQQMLASHSKPANPLAVPPFLSTWLRPLLLFVFSLSPVNTMPRPKVSGQIAPESHGHVGYPHSPRFIWGWDPIQPKGSTPYQKKNWRGLEPHIQAGEMCFVCHRENEIACGPTKRLRTISNCYAGMTMNNTPSFVRVLK